MQSKTLGLVLSLWGAAVAVPWSVAARAAEAASAAPPASQRLNTAQVSSQAPPAQGTGAPPAASGPAASAAPAAAAQPTPEQLQEAKQRFDRGYELYDEGEYSLALIEFTRAYEVVPNYRVLYNIGQVCIQLGQHANARRALEKYLEEGRDELTAERRAAVEKDLVMLGRRTAFLVISANVPDAEVLVDDIVVGRTPLGPEPLLVDAGVHRVTVRRSGYLPRTSRVTLAGGDQQSLDVTLEPQPEDKQTIFVRERDTPSSSETWIVAGWVTTGALVAGAVVTGVLGAKEADELDQLRKGYVGDYADLAGRLDETRSNARTLLLASDLLSASALVVGGLSLWVTLDPPGPERPAAPAQPEGVQVGIAGGQLRVRGSF